MSRLILKVINPFQHKQPTLLNLQLRHQLSQLRRYRQVHRVSNWLNRNRITKIIRLWLILSKIRLRHWRPIKRKLKYPLTNLITKMLRVQLSKQTSPRKLLMIFQMLWLSNPSCNLNNKLNKNLKCLVRVKNWPMLLLDRKSSRLLFFLNQMLNLLQLFLFLQSQPQVLLLFLKLLLKI